MPWYNPNKANEQDRRVALIGLKADLEKLSTLVRESLFKDEYLNEYWQEIVEETARLKHRLIPTQEQEDTAHDNSEPTIAP